MPSLIATHQRFHLLVFLMARLQSSILNSFFMPFNAVDYFITSKRINDKLKKAAIHADILGSDHCPVEVGIEF